MDLHCHECSWGVGQEAAALGNNNEVHKRDGKCIDESCCRCYRLPKDLAAGPHSEKAVVLPG